MRIDTRSPFNPPPVDLMAQQARLVEGIICVLLITTAFVGLLMTLLVTIITLLGTSFAE